MSDVKSAMHSILKDMGHAARAARAKRFSRRAAPEQEEAGRFAVGGDAPSPAHDMAELAMTPEEMAQLVEGR